MQTLHQNAIVPRLALVIAGRRVVQPFQARTLRVSLPRSTELAPSDPNPPKLPLSERLSRLDNSPSAPRPPEKRTKTPPKPKAWKPFPVTAKKYKPTQIKPERQKRARKTKWVPAWRAQGVSQKQVFDRGGFLPDGWSAGWGKDELAPPPPPPRKRRAAPQPRPRRELVPAASNPSSSHHALPPHQIPYVRRTEGYISDNAGQCHNILQDVQSPSEHKPIAQLAHGLDRVLFNPGVYWLRDPRSRIYNFTPWLESIPAVRDFAFERVKGFIKSSMDNDLWKIAKQHKRSFAGSTSSLTGLLSHCYFLISEDKEVDTSSLSRAFLFQPKNFTPGQRMPASVVLNYKEGIWLIDSDKIDELAEKNVLTWLGTMLEKFLTVSEGEFKKLLRSSPVVEEGSDTRPEAYRYAKSERFIMRSQLDCVDPRLPGTGVFDIKTRAVVPIRQDILNYEENSGYLIKTLTGPLESFEKEYYDLIRSAFLKYSFQARIGNMDGVLIAYHNTARIFGFQYVSLEEMEERLYGPGKGMRVFNKCVSLLERILSDVVSIYGERSVKCTFEARELSQELNVWVQPTEWDEVAEGKPCPITELDIRVANHVDGKDVNGTRAITDDRECTIHWTLIESALDEAEIRRRLEDSRDRQFRAALSFPAGIETLEQMEKAWEKIDFGGKQSVREVISAIREFEPPKGTASQERSVDEDRSELERKVSSQDDSGAARALSSDEVTQETDDPNSSASSRTPFFSSPFLTFREPAENIKQLRRLALQGREETLREEAEGREKVVWGSADGWWDRRLRQEENGPPLGGETLPGADDRLEHSKVGGAVVDGQLVVDDSVIVGGSTHREQPLDDKRADR